MDFDKKSLVPKAVVAVAPEKKSASSRIAWATSREVSLIYAGLQHPVTQQGKNAHDECEAQDTSHLNPCDFTYKPEFQDYDKQVRCERYGHTTLETPAAVGLSPRSRAKVQFSCYLNTEETDKIIMGRKNSGRRRSQKRSHGDVVSPSERTRPKSDQDHPASVSCNLGEDSPVFAIPVSVIPLEADAPVVDPQSHLTVSVGSESPNQVFGWTETRTMGQKKSGRRRSRANSHGNVISPSESIPAKAPKDHPGRTNVSCTLEEDPPVLAIPVSVIPADADQPEMDFQLQETINDSPDSSDLLVRLTETPGSKRRSTKVSTGEMFFAKKVLVSSEPNTEGDLYVDVRYEQDVRQGERATKMPLKSELKVLPKPKKVNVDTKPKSKVADKISLFERQVSGQSNKTACSMQNKDQFLSLTGRLGERSGLKSKSTEGTEATLRYKERKKEPTDLTQQSSGDCTTIRNVKEKGGSFTETSTGTHHGKYREGKASISSSKRTVSSPRDMVDTTHNASFKPQLGTKTQPHDVATKYVPPVCQESRNDRIAGLHPGSVKINKMSSSKEAARSDFDLKKEKRMEGAHSVSLNNDSELEERRTLETSVSVCESQTHSVTQPAVCRFSEFDRQKSKMHGSKSILTKEDTPEAPKQWELPSVDHKLKADVNVPKSERRVNKIVTANVTLEPLTQAVPQAKSLQVLLESEVTGLSKIKINVPGRVLVQQHDDASHKGTHSPTMAAQVDVKLIKPVTELSRHKAAKFQSDSTGVHVETPNFNTFPHAAQQHSNVDVFAKQMPTTYFNFTSESHVSERENQMQKNLSLGEMEEPGDNFGNMNCQEGQSLRNELDIQTGRGSETRQHTGSEEKTSQLGQMDQDPPVVESLAEEKEQSQLLCLQQREMNRAVVDMVTGEEKGFPDITQMEVKLPWSDVVQESDGSLDMNAKSPVKATQIDVELTKCITDSLTPKTNKSKSDSTDGRTFQSSFKEHPPIKQLNQNTTVINPSGKDNTTNSSENVTTNRKSTSSVPDGEMLERTFSGSTEGLTEAEWKNSTKSETEILLKKDRRKVPGNSQTVTVCVYEKTVSAEKVLADISSTVPNVSQLPSNVDVFVKNMTVDSCHIPSTHQLPDRENENKTVCLGQVEELATEFVDMSSQEGQAQRSGLDIQIEKSSETSCDTCPEDEKLQLSQIDEAPTMVESLKGEKELSQLLCLPQREMLKTKEKVVTGDVKGIPDFTEMGVILPCYDAVQQNEESLHKEAISSAMDTQIGFIIPVSITDNRTPKVVMSQSDGIGTHGKTFQSGFEEQHPDSQFNQSTIAGNVVGTDTIMISSENPPTNEKLTSYVPEEVFEGTLSESTDGLIQNDRQHYGKSQTEIVPLTDAVELPNNDQTITSQANNAESISTLPHDEIFQNTLSTVTEKHVKTDQQSCANLEVNVLSLKDAQKLPGNSQTITVNLHDKNVSTETPKLSGKVPHATQLHSNVDGFAKQIPTHSCFTSERQVPEREHKKKKNLSIINMEEPGENFGNMNCQDGQSLRNELDVQTGRGSETSDETGPEEETSQLGQMDQVAPVVESLAEEKELSQLLCLQQRQINKAVVDMVTGEERGFPDITQTELKLPWSDVVQESDGSLYKNVKSSTTNRQLQIISPPCVTEGSTVKADKPENDGMGTEIQTIQSSLKENQPDKQFNQSNSELRRSGKDTTSKSSESLTTNTKPTLSELDGELLEGNVLEQTEGLIGADLHHYVNSEVEVLSLKDVQKLPSNSQIITVQPNNVESISSIADAETFEGKFSESKEGQVKMDQHSCAYSEVEVLSLKDAHKLPGSSQTNIVHLHEKNFSPEMPGCSGIELQTATQLHSNVSLFTKQVPTDSYHSISESQLPEGENKKLMNHSLGETDKLGDNFGNKSCQEGQSLRNELDVQTGRSSETSHTGSEEETSQLGQMDQVPPVVESLKEETEPSHLLCLQQREMNKAVVDMVTGEEIGFPDITPMEVSLPRSDVLQQNEQSLHKEVSSSGIDTQIDAMISNPISVHTTPNVVKFESDGTGTHGKIFLSSFKECQPDNQFHQSATAIKFVGKDTTMSSSENPPANEKVTSSILEEVLEGDISEPTEGPIQNDRQHYGKSQTEIVPLTDAVELPNNDQTITSQANNAESISSLPHGILDGAFSEVKEQDTQIDLEHCVNLEPEVFSLTTCGSNECQLSKEGSVPEGKAFQSANVQQHFFEASKEDMNLNDLCDDERTKVNYTLSIQEQDKKRDGSEMESSPANELNLKPEVQAETRPVTISETKSDMKRNENILTVRQLIKEEHKKHKGVCAEVPAPIRQELFTPVLHVTTVEKGNVKGQVKDKPDFTEPEVISVSNGENTSTSQSEFTDGVSCLTELATNADMVPSVKDSSATAKQILNKQSSPTGKQHISASWLETDHGILQQKDHPKGEVSSSIIKENVGTSECKDFIENVKKLGSPFALPLKKHGKFKGPLMPLTMPTIKEHYSEKPFDSKEFKFGLQKNKDKVPLTPSMFLKQQKTETRSTVTPKKFSAEGKSVLFQMFQSPVQHPERNKAQQNADKEQEEESKKGANIISSRLARSSILSSLIGVSSRTNKLDEDRGSTQGNSAGSATDLLLPEINSSADPTLEQNPALTSLQSVSGGITEAGISSWTKTLSEDVDSTQDSSAASTTDLLLPVINSSVAPTPKQTPPASSQQSVSGGITEAGISSWTKRLGEDVDSTQGNSSGSTTDLLLPVINSSVDPTPEQNPALTSQQSVSGGITEAGISSWSKTFSEDVDSTQDSSAASTTDLLLPVINSSVAPTPKQTPPASSQQSVSGGITEAGISSWTKRFGEDVDSTQGNSSGSTTDLLLPVINSSVDPTPEQNPALTSQQSVSGGITEAGISSWSKTFSEDVDSTQDSSAASATDLLLPVINSSVAPTPKQTPPASSQQSVSGGITEAGISSWTKRLGEDVDSMQGNSSGSTTDLLLPVINSSVDPTPEQNPALTSQQSVSGGITEAGISSWTKRFGEDMDSTQDRSVASATDLLLPVINSSVDPTPEQDPAASSQQSVSGIFTEVTFCPSSSSVPSLVNDQFSNLPPTRLPHQCETKKNSGEDLEEIQPSDDPVDGVRPNISVDSCVPEMGSSCVLEPTCNGSQEGNGTQSVLSAISATMTSVSHKRPGKLVIHEQSHFGGEAFEVFRDVMDATSLKLSPVISLRVVRGCWILYEKPCFEGRFIPLEEGPVELLKSWAEEEPSAPSAPLPVVIGSIRLVVRDYSTTHIDLFTEPMGFGIKTSYFEDTPDISAFRLSQSTASIKVHTGMWLVYSEPDFQGLLSVLEPGEYPCAESWGFSVPFVGSLHALRMGGLKVENPEEVKVMVYECPGFKGPHAEFEEDVYSFEETVQTEENRDETEDANIAASKGKKPRSVGSMKILGGLWVGYEGPGFEGRQYILEEGEYVDWNDWGGHQTKLFSLRPVLTDFLSPHLKLYSERDFDSRGMSVDFVDLALNIEGTGLKAQAIEVLAGVWVAFEKPDFSGQTYILEKGLYGKPEDWGAQNTRISSLQPVVQIQLFSKPGFKGTIRLLEESVSELPSGFTLGSCRVLSGSWLGFEGPGFTNQMHVLEEGDYPSLNTPFCSFQTTGLELSVPSITLFAKPGFKGRKVVLRNGTANLRLAECYVCVQSVKVDGGLWVVYQCSNFRGRQILLRPGEVGDWLKLCTWKQMGSLRPLTQKAVYFRLRNRETGLLMSLTGPLDDIALVRIQAMKDTEGAEQVWVYRDGQLHSKIVEHCCLVISGTMIMPGSRLGLSSQPKHCCWNITRHGLVRCQIKPDLVLEVKGGHHYDRGQVILNTFSENKPNQRWSLEML